MPAVAEGSLSPLRQRKVESRYRGRAGSISPLHQRNADKHYYVPSESELPSSHRELDKHGVVRMNSVSPLRQRTFDKHYILQAGSVSPLRKRKVDHYRMRAGSRSPLHQRNEDPYYGIPTNLGSPLHHRNADNHYGMHLGSVSPIRQRKVGHRYDASFGHPFVRNRGRGLRGGRGLGKFRETSPPYGRGRGRGRGRSFERSFDRPGYVPLQMENDEIRDDPNVSPREGDWICYSCGNLNFVWRTSCSNCNMVRAVAQDGPSGSPRRRYVGSPSPPAHRAWPRIPSPPLNRGPGRFRNEFDSPPHGWSRDSPPPLGMGHPPPRRVGRLPDHIRRERSSFHDRNDFQDRSKHEMLMPAESDPDGGLNGDHFHGRRYEGRDERRMPSSPTVPLSYRDDWVDGGRARSRSPLRGRGPKNYRRGPFMGRGRNGRQHMERMRMQTRY